MDAHPPKPPRHWLNPRIMGVRVSVLWDLYRVRLRNHAVAELLAGTGIAIGVALVFGVFIANTSITGSTAELIRAVNGSARLQLAARSSEGFSEQIATEAGRLPGVRNAASLLREPAVIRGPRGSREIQFVGVNAGIIAMGGSATRNLGAGALLLSGGVGLPSGLAGAIGAQTGAQVTLLANGDAHTVLVRAVLDSGAIGAVAESPVAVALLPIAQRLAEQPGRVTQVLIKPQPGAERQVEGELRGLAAGRLGVAPADSELGVLDEAAKPLHQSTSLFVAISAMVGLLLALNAMLLTVADRRRFVAELCTQGFDSPQIVLILGFQALLLGLLASLAGLALGDVLARTLFHQTPVYLAVAFPVSIHETVHLASGLLALAGGVLAALLASLPPLFDLWSGRPVDAALNAPGDPAQRIGRRTTRRLGVLGLAIVAGVTVLVLAIPSLTVVGGIMLALAAPMLVPAIFVNVTRNLKRLGRRARGSMLAVAVVELDSTAARSVALIGVTALAVYGSVAIQGTRADLTRGLNDAVVEFLDTANVWVSTGDNFLTIDTFRAGGAPAAIARAPGVASVRTYQGGVLDIGSRRLWIRARSPADPAMIQASQLLHGNLALATRLIRGGGWAAVSSGFAEERHLQVGDSFTLPTPTGAVRFGVAAITANAGWSPGAITINTTDYAHYWRVGDPTALEVDLKPGVTPTQGKVAVERALGSRPGLRVETLRERERSFEASAHEGLRPLGEISTLLLITAALAVASVLGATIWQRRARLASLKTQGFDELQLWRALLLESTISVAIGCADGAILGVYGHVLASRWLKLTTGFPAPFSLGAPEVLLALAIVTAITLLIVAAPGLSAARVPPSLGFQE
ncbi:MAG TPA: FtsX-like permease family protein [Solirubrobacteraceae bacterium]|jgi:putative ABC transport system permease protein|nr:FtsX-like permease family protein [Solirubrobacteraceae bacterium]